MKKITTGLKDLDKYAYHVVCNWYKAIDFNPMLKGVDYSQIIRFYLWDKVGRAIRIQHNIDFGEIDIYNKDHNSPPFYYTPVISKGKFRKPIFRRNKLIFIPFVVPLYLINELAKENKVKIITKEVSKSLSGKNVIKSNKNNCNKTWHIDLYNAVIRSLGKMEIELILEDKQLLKKQIEGAVYISNIAEQELKKYRPNALYVYSDNHPPFINYVLAAKNFGIPTFTYQHGLDCEHYFLDDSYADYVGVWSENRKNSYLKKSQFIAKKYKVIGKINNYKPTLSKKLEEKKTILFITRPHKPIKCYSPSRNHLEGVKIMKAIIDFMILNKEIYLVIKAHPSDNTNNYKDLVNEFELNERIVISEENVEDLALRCKVIVTEDSTAGIEAISYYKPCIHAHFANSEPVLPFLKYGAAYSGKSPIEIVENLEKAFNLSDAEMRIIKDNQQKLINDLIPFGDTNDFIEFLLQNIE